MKKLGLVVLMCAGVSFASCTHGLEKKLIRCDVHETGYPKETVNIETSPVGQEGPDLMSVIIRDSLVISLERSQPYLFSISDLRTGELMMMCCRKGRSANEPVSAIPVRETFEEDGDMKTYVYSYNDSRVFEWNISASLVSGKDVYERIVRIGSSENETMLPLMSCYNFGRDEIIVRNSGQDPQREEFLDVPVYEIYSLEDGSRAQVYDSMFSHAEIPVENESLLPKYYLSGSDCISPDCTRIAYAMGYMPYLIILDLNDGHSEAFRLTGQKAFDPTENRWCFTSVQADESHIYALYYGGIIDDRNFDACPDTLYVFDWTGKLLKEIHLDRHFTDLTLDTRNSRLYLTHRMRSGIFCIDTENF